MNADDLLTALPGESAIRQGLIDFPKGLNTVPACLVAIALPRLQAAGLLTGETPDPESHGELHLYRLLRASGPDAYSRYNALIRQLISFEQALDHRCNRAIR